MFQFLILSILLASGIAWYRLIQQKGVIPLTQRLPRDTFPRCFLAVILTLMLITLGLVNQFSPQADALNFDLRTVASSNLQSAVLILILLGLLKVTPGRIAQLEDYGITDEALRTQLRDGGLGFLLAIIPVTICRALTLPLLTDEGMHPLIKLVNGSDNAALWGHVLLAAAVLAPILEELMYRVILQSWLKRWVSVRHAIILTAIVFSGMHGFPHAIALFPLALILGYVYEVRHRYFTIVVIHMLFNFTNLMMLLLAPEEVLNPTAQP